MHGKAEVSDRQKTQFLRRVKKSRQGVEKGGGITKDEARAKR